MSSIVKSEVLQEFINKPENTWFPLSKEERIKEHIHFLNNSATNLKDRVFNELSIWFILFIPATLIVNSISLYKNEILLSDYVLRSSSVFLFSLFIIAITDFANRSSMILNFLELKKLLEPKKYETRAKFVSYFSSTLKIVVEGNECSDGLVIKENPRHFTSYLETENKVNLIKNLVKIIEKQESMFQNKKS